MHLHFSSCIGSIFDNLTVQYVLMPQLLVSNKNDSASHCQFAEACMPSGCSDLFPIASHSQQECRNVECPAVNQFLTLCRVLQPLQAAAISFTALENYSKAAEAQHLIAVVCHAINNTSMRNAAAGEFHKLTWQAQQAQCCC